MGWQQELQTQLALKDLLADDKDLIDVLAGIKAELEALKKAQAACCTETQAKLNQLILATIPPPAVAFSVSIKKLT